MHAIHLSVPRAAFLACAAALLATVAVLAAAARLSDVSFGVSGSGGKPAPITARGPALSGVPRSAFLGSPFASPFQMSLPWKAPVR